MSLDKINILRTFILSLLVIYINNIFILILCLLIILCKYESNKHICIAFIITIFLFNNYNYPKSFENECTIQSIKNNYVIADCNETVILKNINNINYGDVIKLTDYEINNVHTSNFNIFNFNEYLLNKKINNTIEVKSYNMIEESNSIRSKVFNKINDNEYIKKFLFNINLDNNIIMNSGLHILTLFYLIKKLLLFKLNYKLEKIILILLAYIISLFTIPTFILYRVIIKNTISLFNNDRYINEILPIFIIFILFKELIYDYGFVYFLIFTIIRLFYKTNIFTNKLILLIIQLVLYSKINLISICLFNITRKLYMIGYVFALIAIFVESNVLMNYYNILYIYDTYIVNFDIYCSLNIIKILIVIFFIIYLNINKNKYLIYTIVMIGLIPYAFLFKPYYQVYFLDVGQGDSAVILSPFELTTTVIDIPKYKGYIIDDFLDSFNIDMIDYLIISHDDSDHSKGAYEITKDFNELVMYKDFSNYNINYLNIHLLPNTNFNDINKNSIINYISIYNKNILFTGDISIDVEKEIVRNYPNITIDILKVAHHGSKTSSNIEFLNYYKPSFSIISSGRDNMYNHPSSEVIDNFNRLNLNYFNTAYNGSSKLIITKYFAYIQTYDNKFSFF